MSEARWTNPSQPQMLQIAVFLLYAHAFFTALDVLDIGADTLIKEDFLWGVLFIATIPAGVFAGRGIASEQKWAYALGIAVAASPFILRVMIGRSLFGTGLITLMFEIALVALLVHPQSRDYQRIWFK